jgi:UDP-N-acetylglucosamine 2-epimerase (non-hydrolysing)
VTIDQGTSILVGSSTEAIWRESERILDGHGKRGAVPPLWDGRTADRIATIVETYLRPEQAASGTAEWMPGVQATP